MYIRIWEFVVRSSAVDAFTALYGPTGGWVEHFSSFEGFLGTELLRDDDDASRFLTLDRWSSEGAYAAVDTSSERWRALDADGDALSERETLLGVFDIVADERPTTSG